MINPQTSPSLWHKLWYFATLVLYLVLTTYQLGLPGLHYDEAKEAGINAMELWQGAPVTAFRGATIHLFGLDLPLMVQDYIGALNVYLSIPFLALSGVGVPNLRLLPICIGLLSLIALERAIAEWCQLRNAKMTLRNPITLAGLVALTLLAASPSFVFWNRQGIFVTNLTPLLCLWCIGQGIRWFRLGNTRFGRAALLRSAFAGGLALYAKLMAIWVIGPFAILMAGWWLKCQVFTKSPTPKRGLSTPLLIGVVSLFLLPLIPFFLFNWQTSGTTTAIFGNLEQSYYGIDNRDIVNNVQIRWQQLMQTLRGDHFWYLGGLYGNGLAVWLGGVALLVGLWRQGRFLIGPLSLVILGFGLSLFTISDLFVTHYALLHPLVVGLIALSLSTWVNIGKQQGVSFLRVQRYLVPLFLSVWFILDLTAALNYHRLLKQSGGLADHADATYHLAYHLRYNGIGAPISLDWGMDASVRFLSEGAVTPIEIFGYMSPQVADDEFEDRLGLFLADQENVYLLHAPAHTVFAGRREVFLEQAKKLHLTPVLEKGFTQRDGTPLFELWRAEEE